MVDRLALVDRSTRRTATDWSIGQPRYSHELRRFRSFSFSSLSLAQAYSSLLISDRMTGTIRPSIRVHILYLPLVEVTYPLLSSLIRIPLLSNRRRSCASVTRLRSSLRMLFKFVEWSARRSFIYETRPRVFSLGTAPRQPAAISSLNATNPAICLFCRAWQWNTLCARDATVRFDHLHPFILRRIAVLFQNQVWSATAFVSREIYSYPILYPIPVDAGWIFIIFLFVDERYWSIKSIPIVCC